MKCLAVEICRGLKPESRPIALVRFSVSDSHAMTSFAVRALSSVLEVILASRASWTASTTGVDRGDDNLAKIQHLSDQLKDCYSEL